jgi:hypothetical protein
MDDKVSDRERRLVLRVLNRWQERRGERTFLPRHEAGPGLFGPDWPSCFVLDLADPHDPGFIEIGEAYRRDHDCAAWRRVSDCRPGTLLRHATEFFPQVLLKRIPISIGGAGQHGGSAILFRAILLPLSGPGGGLDAMLGAANYRAIAGEGG